jgi:hypothetical protein
MADRLRRWFVVAHSALLGAALTATGCQVTVSVAPFGSPCQKGSTGGGVAPLNARPQWTAPPQPELPPPGWMPPPPSSGQPPATTGLRPVPPSGAVRGPDLPPLRGPITETGTSDGS